MAATVEVHRVTGASPGSGTDISGGKTYLTTSDNHYSASPPYPVAIPPSAQNYSYWASLRLKCTATPDTAIDNVRFYMDAAFAGGSGITFAAQLANVGADAGYRQATGTQGTTGDELNETNHTGLVAAVEDLFTWTPDAPKDLTATLNNPDTGFFGDFVVMQAIVAAGAAGAAQPDSAFTFLWDET